MKKLVYLFLTLTIVFTSCNPMEDIYAELEESTKLDGVVGDVIYTLTEDDYTEDVDDGGLGFSFANFSDTDQAKALLPAFLSKRYPALGVKFNADGGIDVASSANITYDIFFPKRTERSLVVYEVEQADYDAQGGNVARFGNFSSFDDIVAFLNTKYPNPDNRLLVSLTYRYYNGARTVDLENGFIIVDGTWEMATGITADEYTAMGEERAQFSNEDEALQKIPLYAKNKFQYTFPKAKDIQGIMYKLFVTDTEDIDGDGRTDDRALYSYLTYVIYDGSNWSIYNNVLSESLQFGHDGTTWVPDNTIKYTLTSADYALVGNGNFENFDVRAGRDEETVEARRAKISTILLNNFPQYGAGQKFSVSYNVWKPGDDVFVMNVIHDGTEYVLQ